MDKSTAYRLLGLNEGASEEDVKAAYKTLAQKYNADSYDAGPLRDEAAQKMAELNDAFDLLMSYLRTGAPQAQRPQNAGHAARTGGGAGRWAAIRAMINSGRLDEALAELNAASAQGDAEWNFLMGSVYYYKGWLDQALMYFQQAVRLDPGNREYEAAMRNLQNSRNGQMNGSPYAGKAGEAQALGCACDTCTLICCLDACCGMGRGC